MGGKREEPGSMSKAGGVGSSSVTFAGSYSPFCNVEYSQLSAVCQQNGWHSSKETLRSELSILSTVGLLDLYVRRGDFSSAVCDL